MIHLKELRDRNKISQKDLASRLGVAQNTLSNWENGNRHPDPEMLTKIADYFDVSLDYLLGRCDNPSPVHEVFAASFHDGMDYDDLPEEARQELENYRQYLRQKYAKK